MKPNLKFETKDGVQVALYPSINMNVTQNPYETFSHNNVKAMDQSWHATPKLYAPVDMVCAAKFANQGQVYYHTIDPVMTPSGLKHFTLFLQHDNNWNSWQVGKIYRQGEHIYTEGTEGYVTGSHVHIQVAEGHTTTRIPLAEGGNALKNEMFLDELVFVNHTNIINANSPGTQTYYFNWKTYEDGYTPNKDKDDHIYHAMLSFAFPFNM